jgi:radical SAM protein with 4Fe4S-binding SPASM domain
VSAVRDRVLAAPDMTPAKPRHVYALHFDIVHGCQLRCVGCPNSTLEPKIHRIAVDDFHRCLTNIDVERVHTLRLYNYGEPLLHPQLASIVAQIPRQRWRASVVEISTNAQWVDWTEFEEMLKLEVVTKLVVSCDGDGTPEQYERLRPPSKWGKLIEFLERATYLRDRWSPAMQLWTRTVIRSREDARRWEAVLKPRGFTPEFRRWMALPQSQENMTGRPVIVPRGPCVFLAEPSEFTNHPWFGEVNLLYVDADGSVVPCCMHPRAGVFGNLLTQKYSDIRNGSARGAMKDAMTKDRASMPVCASCDVGPVGKEGPSFWSAITYWSPNKNELPERAPELSTSKA